MTFAIRSATPADASAAADVIAAALIDYGIHFDPAGRDADVALFGSRADHDDLVAEVDGKIAGVASVGPHGDDGVAWVSKVFVLRSARGRGIGRALVHALHDAARARGYREVRLRTRIVFEEAIALYQSLGYVRTTEGAAVLESGDVVYARPL